MSYLVHDLAFDAAYEAYNCDNEPDAPCQHEDNEPLFQALMVKVGSYHPEEESYQADAYYRAAEKVCDLEVSVFSLKDKKQRHLGVGKKTSQFIYEWILSRRVHDKAPAEQDLEDPIKFLIKSLINLTEDMDKELDKELINVTEDMDALREQFKTMPSLLEDVIRASTAARASM